MSSIKSTLTPSLIPGKELRCTAPKLEPGVGGINVVDSPGGALLQAADEEVYFLKTNLGGAAGINLSYYFK